jgi:hypothetical protein
MALQVPFQHAWHFYDCCRCNMGKWPQAHSAPSISAPTTSGAVATSTTSAATCSSQIDPRQGSSWWGTLLPIQEIDCSNTIAAYSCHASKRCRGPAIVAAHSACSFKPAGSWQSLHASSTWMMHETCIDWTQHVPSSLRWMCIMSTAQSSYIHGCMCTLCIGGAPGEYSMKLCNKLTHTRSIQRCAALNSHWRQPDG